MILVAQVCIATGDIPATSGDMLSALLAVAWQCDGIARDDDYDM